MITWKFYSGPSKSQPGFEKQKQNLVFTEYATVSNTCVVSSSPALCPFDMLLPGSSFCCRPPCLWGADVESFVVLVSLLPTLRAYRSGIEEAKERARSLDTIPESLSYLSEYSTGLGATAASASSPQVSVSSAYLLHGEKSSPASIWNRAQSLWLKLLLQSNSNISVRSQYAVQFVENTRSTNLQLNFGASQKDIIDLFENTAKKKKKTCAD